jgi:hypothetical protein
MLKPYDTIYEIAWSVNSTISLVLPRVAREQARYSLTKPAGAFRTIYHVAVVPALVVRNRCCRYHTNQRGRRGLSS